MFAVATRATRARPRIEAGSLIRACRRQSWIVIMPEFYSDPSGRHQDATEGSGVGLGRAGTARQGHEGDREQPPLADLASGVLLDQHEILAHRVGADRDHQATAGLE